MFIVNSENRDTAKQLYPQGPAWISRRGNFDSLMGEKSYVLCLGEGSGLVVAIASDRSLLVEYAQKQGWQVRV